MSLEDPTQKITIYPNQNTENFSYTPIECSTRDIKDYYKPLSEIVKKVVPSTIVRNFDAHAILNIIDAYKQDIQSHYEIKSPLNFYAIIRTPDTKETVLEELNKLDNFFQDRDAARNIQEGNSVRIGNKGNIVFYYCPVFTNLKKFHIDFGVKKEQSILVPCGNMEFRLKLNYIFEFEKDVIKSKKDETTKIMPIRKDTEPEEVIPILDEEEELSEEDKQMRKKINDFMVPHKSSTPLFQLPQEQAEKLKKSSLQQFKSEHKYIEKTVEETLKNLEKCSPKSPHENDELTAALKEEYKKIEENNQKKLKEEEERLKNNTFKIVGPGEYKITVSPNVSYVVNGVPTYSGPITYTTGSASNYVMGVSSRYIGIVDENGKVSDLEHVGDKVVPSSIEEAARKFQRETEEMKEWEKRVSNLVGNRVIGEDVGADIEPGKEELSRKNLKAEAERIAKEGKPVSINGDSVECTSGLGITKKEEEQRTKENWKTVTREEFYGIPSNKGKPVSDKMNNYDTFAPVFQKDYITKERCFNNVGKNGMLPELFKNATKGFYVREAINSSLSDETILLQKQNLLKEYAKQFGENDVYAPSEVANMTVYKVSFIKHHILYENGIKFILSKNEDGLVFYGDKPLPEKGLTRFITKSYKCLADAITDLSHHQKRGILVVKEISPEEYVETLFPSWVPRNDLRVRFYVIEPEKVKEEPKKVKIDQETGTTWSIEKGNKPKRLSDYKSWEDMVGSIKDSAELPASYKDIPGVVGCPKPLKTNQEELDKAVSNLLDPACYVDDKTLAEIEKKTNESFRSEENK